ncbi:MAG: glycogen/starch/alpha-glucan phosphorylase, partial [Anaerolineae bacterium]|nr:glycogen/starch/alpha-glucan phosphorylase [Anaerolineae bacterium]
QRVMHLLRCGHFNSFERNIFNGIIDSLLSPNDPWLTLADFRDYIDIQDRVSQAYRDKNTWTAMSIKNTVCSGYFSTDRTIREYNMEIWKL